MLARRAGPRENGMRANRILFIASTPVRESPPAIECLPARNRGKKDVARSGKPTSFAGICSPHVRTIRRLQMGMGKKD